MDSFVGMDHCITDTRKNIIVEVPKGMCDDVRTVLKRHFPDEYGKRHLCLLRCGLNTGEFLTAELDSDVPVPDRIRG